MESHLPLIKKKETGESFNIVIPECCREGWDSCKHVSKPFKKSKQNIGL